MLSMNFLLCKAQADIPYSSSKTLMDDVVFPREAVFMKLAYSVVGLFRDHESMARFQLTVVAKIDSVEDSTMLAPRINQHYKISVEGAGVLVDKTEKMTFCADCVPLHLMGGGTFSLTREDLVLQAILAGVDSEALPSLVYRLAGQLATSFKSLATPVFSLGEAL